MECSCDCRDLNDYEIPRIHSVATRKARKPRHCIECGERIQVGHDYESVSALYDGRWFRCATCLPCKRIRTVMCSCGFIYGELRETVREALGMDYVTGEWVD